VRPGIRYSTLSRILVVSLLFGVGLGIASFFALRALNESSSADWRRHTALFMAQTVESGPFDESVRDRRFRAGRRAQGADIWVVGPDGTVLATNAGRPLPVAWAELSKPAAVHELTVHYRPFRLFPDLVLVRLESQGEAYLLIESRRTPGGGAVWVEAAFFLFVVGIAVLIALVMTYAYLRRKSREARVVLARLEKGDLAARFELRGVDEVGELMLDFNRMASEIERLVLRLRETEATRRNLLEELSHDLRTPLTSLRTSIETMVEHSDEMPAEQRKEFLDVCRAELSYFVHLIDDLFFIADLGEPRYKKAVRAIDVSTQIEEELRSRRMSAGKLRWTGSSGRSAPVLGDPLLVLRLIKNAFDNAAKHARSEISVGIQPRDGAVEVTIDDDGPGISDEAIASFGNRRLNREASEGTGPASSLGLGSVIMKTILELHGGRLKIERLPSGGTRLTLTLPSGGAGA
jgi:signal transduction histidine kinase